MRMQLKEMVKYFLHCEADVRTLNVSNNWRCQNIASDFGGEN